MAGLLIIAFCLDTFLWLDNFYNLINEGVKSEKGPFSRPLLLRENFKSGMCGAEFFPAGRGGVGRECKSAGRGKDEIPRGGPGRGGAKKRVNQLIQKFDKSAYIVTGGCVLQYGALINENITFPDF